MTTPAVYAPPPTMTAFNPVMPINQPPGVTANGADNTQKIERHTTPIKIELIVHATQTAFNLAKALKILKDKDPTLEIIPSKDGKDAFQDLEKFPASKNECNNQFEHAIQKEPTEARKILVHHSLLANFKFLDLKFQNAKLMDHLHKNKICVRCNQSKSLEVAALGFIQDVHPRITFRDHFVHNLSEAIHLEMTDAEQVKLNEVLPTPKNSTAEAGEIITPDIKLVFGLTPQVPQHIIAITDTDKTERQMTVQQFITSQPSIHGIEPIAVAPLTLGKCL
jgi:hypothetical protein